MTYCDFLRSKGWGSWVSREFDRHLGEVYPQLNPRSTVVETPSFTITVMTPLSYPAYLETETVYVPRTDWKGRVLLALGALLNSPLLWNPGFTADRRLKAVAPRAPGTVVELQNFGVRAGIKSPDDGHEIPVDHYLCAGYCAYNDTLYVRK